MQNLFDSPKNKKRKKAPEVPAAETREKPPEPKENDVIPPVPNTTPHIKKKNHILYPYGIGVTLYDLEALSLSANLVFNDKNIDELNPILRKSLREHEELFGPLVEILRIYGR
jgi:hypothetical protein